jgi:hypothetical protein
MSIIHFTCTLIAPMYVHNNKTYIEVKLDADTIEIVHQMHENTKHLLRSKIVQDPLKGAILRIKIPMRQTSMLYTTLGNTPLRSMIRGDQIDVTATFCGAWTYGDFCGYAWKLSQVALSTTY